MDTLSKAVKSDGTELCIGDQVHACRIYEDGRRLWFHYSCRDVIFIVESIVKYKYCSCGYLVVVHMKEDPSRKILGCKRSDENAVGISADWFVRV